MGQRNDYADREALAGIGGVHLAVHLPFDDQPDQSRAESGMPRPPRRRAIPLDPVKGQGQAAPRARDRPGQFKPALRPRQTAMLDSVGSELVQRGAEAKGWVRLKIDI